MQAEVRSAPGPAVDGRLDDEDARAEYHRRLLNRLRRIEGQARGVQRMVREEAPDVEVLTQISSLIAALEQVAAIVLQYHVEYRVRASIENRDESEESVAELRVAVQRFLGTRRRR